MAKKETEKKETVKKTTKTKVKDVKKTNIHEISIKIEGEEWTKATDAAFKKAQKNVVVDGFRKGKVPRNVFEKKYGKESLYRDAAEDLLQTAYLKALTDSKLIPVVRPSVDIKSIDEKGVEFTFKIITKPEVNVKKYKGLKVKKNEVEVTKEEIDHELGHVLERYSELVLKEDGKVENGDISIINFEGFKDGEPFDGGKAENYSLEIGSNTFIPGFEEKLIGMKAGEEKDIDLVFPEDYGAKDLAGQPVVFKVKVNEIKQKQNRKLDEEFFEDLGMDGVNSEKELRAEIEKSIKAHKEAHEENNYVDALLGEVAKNVEVDIPEEMVDEEVEHLLHRFEDQLKSQGISLELYYAYTNSDEAALRNQFEKEAYTNVLYRLMLEEIMNIEKIEVSEEETDKELEKMVEQYKMTKEEILKEIGDLSVMQYELEMRKTIELLKELNK